jgi:DNA-binding GntR family transcriptional regulator
VPRIQRQKPLHIQVAEFYKKKILSGELVTGDRLPSLRDMAREWDVGFQTAQRAVDYLSKVEGLVRTAPEGTFVNGHRVTHGPQQRLRSESYPRNQRLQVRAAELIPAPAYIVPILDLDERDGALLVRREWVTSDDSGHPFRLSVAWVSALYTEAVPELLDLAPLPDPAGEAHLIAERTGEALTGGDTAMEARKVKDDGREGPLLALQLGDSILAMVEVWGIDGCTTCYTEHAIREGWVIEAELLP